MSSDSQISNFYTLVHLKATIHLEIAIEKNKLNCEYRALAMGFNWWVDSQKIGLKFLKKVKIDGYTASIAWKLRVAATR